MSLVGVLATVVTNHIGYEQFVFKNNASFQQGKPTSQPMITHAMQSG
jgi:hypothetical protein